MPRQLARSPFASLRTQRKAFNARLTLRSKAVAAACAIESLEKRQLLSFSVGINFQPSGSTVPTGYLQDSGAAYASRGNGYSYGWNANDPYTRDRNLVTDQRYDTTILTQLYGSYTWEMAVPNGTYRVRAVAGDAAYSDSVYKFNVEGQTLIDGTPTDSNRFVAGTAIVNVTDGRLTISNAPGSQNNKLAFVDITSIDVPAVAGTTYVSDLTPVSATNGWGPVEKDMSNGEQAAGDGNVLNLGGTTYQKGLGVNANSSVVYNLGGNYQTFAADIGVDNEATSTGSVVFQVLADGKKIYDSGLMTKATGKKSISLLVTGVAQLTLVVTDGGNGNNNDHADWANAQLVPTSSPTITVPAAPSNLAATALSSTQVKLTWADNSSNETGFVIARSTDGTTFTTVATTASNTTSFTDATVTAGTTYYYRVLAYNTAGNSTTSNTAQVAVPTATTTTIPTAPSVLVATAMSSTQVKLTWADNSSNESGFTLARSTDGTSFATVATLGANTTSYTDSTATAGTTYYYRVLAYNSAGSSTTSNTAQVTTPATVTVPTAPSNLAATAASATQVNLTWTDNSSNESGFKVERSTDGTTFTALGTVGAGVTTYSDTTAAAATTYTYRVTAYNTARSSAASNLAAVTTPSATPTVTPTYVVSTTGSDSNSGSATSPFRTVAKALSVAQPGNIILVKNGTYHESLSLTRSGASGKPITLMGESTSGVVFDGTGLSSVIVANGAQYITIENLTVRYAANGPQNYQAAVKTGSNWTLQDMVVEKVDGTGICANGSNVTIQRVTSQDNGVAGIGADHATNVLVKDCITRRNNNGMSNPSWKTQTTISGYPAATLVNGLWYMNPDFEAGGGKYWQCTGVTIDGLQADDNVGPGIWFDYQSTNVTIRNCKSFNNRGIDSSHKYQGNGMRFELQDQGPFLVQNNLVYGNSGQAIDIESSRNITITGNTLVGGAVLFRDANRGAQYTDYNLKITNNQIKNGYFETWEGTWNSSSGATKAIVIDGNTYDNGGGKLFLWGGTSYSSLSTIRSTLGFELTGTLGTVTVLY